MGKTAPAEDLSAKKALALTVIDRLKNEYPDAGCTLDYDHAWQLLVSVRLAAQCTDARVNIVVQELFAKYPDVAALAAAEPEDIDDSEVTGVLGPMGGLLAGALFIGISTRRRLQLMARAVGQRLIPLSPEASRFWTAHIHPQLKIPQEI